MSDLWCQTRSGVPFDLVNPLPSSVRFSDVVSQLSRLQRFSGSTIRPWNVLQHSLLACALLPEDATPATRVAALLHDAHEAYIGDITSPVAAALGEICPAAKSTIAILKARVQAAVDVAFGAEHDYSITGHLVANLQARDVHQVDMLALAAEKAILMAPAQRQWAKLPEVPPAASGMLAMLEHVGAADAGLWFWAAIREHMRAAGFVPMASLGLTL